MIEDIIDRYSNLFNTYEPYVLTILFCAIVFDFDYFTKKNKMVINILLVVGVVSRIGLICYHLFYKHSINPSIFILIRFFGYAFCFFNLNDFEATFLKPLYLRGKALFIYSYLYYMVFSVLVNLFSDSVFTAYSNVFLCQILLVIGFAMIISQDDVISIGYNNVVMMFVFMFVSLIFSYAKVYQMTSLSCADNITACAGVIDTFGDRKVFISSYQDALYFSIVTMTTLGYGDLLPTPPMRLMAASESISGVIGASMLISLVLKG